MIDFGRNTCDYSVTRLELSYLLQNKGARMGASRMQVVCSKCSKVLEYSGDCPSFCAYCGHALADLSLNTPSGFDPEGLTQVGAGTGGSGTRLRTLGGYKLMRELGSGGMGAVYEAEETA